MIVIYQALDLLHQLTKAPSRDERGLSQSTENAILLAGAVTIALLIITVITAFVKDNLPS